MSKIGNKPIIIPEGVEIEIMDREIKVKGPKGELGLKVHPRIKVEKKENLILVKRASNSKLSRSLHGLFRNLIFNMFVGVQQGYKKELELHGLGYRVSISDEKGEQKLVLLVGFSHPVEFKTPEGINFSVNKNIITVEGIDKHLVGQTAAKIRGIKPPEPYKGKGIRYKGEVVKKKPGKAVVKVAGAA